MEFERPSRNEILRTLGGVCLILVALKLPSVSVNAHGGWGLSGTQSGWWCARQANQMMQLLPSTFMHSAASFSIPLFGLSGMINPLLVLSLIPIRIWQFWCAVGIFFCLAATWLAMVLFSFTPLIGHFLWVAGVLLIVSREWDAEPVASWRAGRAND